MTAFTDREQNLDVSIRDSDLEAASSFALLKAMSGTSEVAQRCRVG